jgi:DNA-binding transcriptional regulator YdaS (Cro superfamily)
MIGMRWNLKKKIVEEFGSQLNFAHEIGLNPSILSQIVLGRRPIDPGEQKRWAEMLGGTPQEIFGREIR